MSDVFISCSRWHIDCVRHLFGQLKDRDRDPWSMGRLAGYFSNRRAADSFLFIISSETWFCHLCTLEIERAANQNLQR